MTNLTEARATIARMKNISAGPLGEVATYAEIIGWYVADLRQMMWALDELSVDGQTDRIDEVVRLPCQVRQALNMIDMELAKARGSK